MKRLISISFLFNVAVAMLIPEDAEMLEGYAPVSYPEISPEDDYFEARSLSASTLFNSIRNKRNTNYEVLESDGLISHFRPNSVNAFKTIFVLKPNLNQIRNEANQKIRPPTETMHTDSVDFSAERKVRSIENETKKYEKSDIAAKNDSIKSNENLPIALKQVMKSGNFYPDLKSVSASALVSKWTRTPFEYSKIQQEEDSMAMDSSSSMNEGIKARTPRVNFVTQQKKSRDHNDDSNTSATKPEYYKSPPLIHNTKEPNTNNNDHFPERSSARPSSYPDYSYRDREVDKQMIRYDNRYTDDGMYPPPPYDQMPEYRRFYDMYDPYMPRSPSFPEPYYEYPDSRYDVPDYRDYPPMYQNDVEDRYYSPNDMAPPPAPPSRRRIIYYANLPEVVRSPPTVDLRYRSYDRYDPYYDYYNPMMSSYRKPMPERQSIPSIRPLKSVESNRSSKIDKRFERNEKPENDKSSMRSYSQSHRSTEYGGYY